MLTRRFEIVWLVLLFLAGYVYSRVANAEPTFSAKHAYVVNLTTGEVVINKKQTDIVPIASITKLMTALVIVDSDLNLAEEITIEKNDLEATKESRRNLGLPVGSTYTREELVLIALMSSNNRAAAALARTHPAGYQGFVELMNQKARELDMIDTSFVDPSGIFNNNVSTAEDLIKLLQAVKSRPTIGQFSTETSYKKQREVTSKVKTRVENKKTKKVEVRVSERTQTVTDYYGTTNRLLLTDDWNIHLQKTGFIRAAGFCVTMIINISGEDYAIVLLNAASKQTRAIDAVKAKYWVEYRVVPTRQILTTLNPYKRAERGR